MFTTQQIEFIREYGNKELTEGCVIVYRMDDDFDNDGHICKLTQPSEFDDDWVYCIYPRTPYWHTDYVDLKNKYDVEVIEILWHPVEWHNVFAKLKEMWYESFLWSESLLIDPDNKKWEKKNIELDRCLSPMDQPLFIEELLKLIK